MIYYTFFHDHENVELNTSYFQSHTDWHSNTLYAHTCEKCGSIPIIPGDIPTAIGSPPAIGRPMKACASCCC